MSDYLTFGPLSYQRHTDWRCSTTAWQRGRWRPVVTLRIGAACRPGFGVFIDKDEEGDWSLLIAGVVFDVLARVTGPWESP